MTSLAHHPNSVQLYWLTLNGTVHIYNLAKKLTASGFVQQALPFVVFCVKAMETHVIFSMARYLPWRTQLYSTLCNAYLELRAYDLAKMVIAEGKVSRVLHHIINLFLSKLFHCAFILSIKTCLKNICQLPCSLRSRP